MPVYEYECENGHSFEEVHSVEDRNEVRCKCGARTRIVIGQVAVISFTPYYSPALKRWVTSSRDKSRGMQKRGFEEFSDVDEVKQEAEKAKRQEEQRYLNEKPDRKFLECFSKAQAEHPSH